ncbi:MAG: pyruvate, phosphate dikinase, partial [Bacteroidetes bacterium]|nr:pyruvate, phosphate dikinase [Bacteroidota bacterium]
KMRTITINGRTFGENDIISIDGTSGEVMAGEVKREEPKLSEEFEKLMTWADYHRTMEVWTNADTPHDAQRARGWGAQGIGLCRTEHMFFEADRITDMREMILAESEEDRINGLNKLLPHQKEDFVGLFTAMQGLPVTVRLLDPPLHEFLPHEENLQQELADHLKVPIAKIRTRVNQLHESNPMLGHRGCRLSISYPEIMDMQVSAITEAAIICKQKGIDARPEIMVPLVGSHKELALLRKGIEEKIQEVKDNMGHTDPLHIPIGTMIEIPRAALTADQVAVYADFFSFGTNDLTQMTFGYSRDDINSFLPNYLQQEIMERDPFQSLDTSGVGQLLEMTVKKGRGVKKGMKMGICGEHGGDPLSIRFCQKLGLSYISCSPFRVPVARLAAAQAAVLEKMHKASEL